MHKYALILEDSPTQSRIISKMFERAGFSATTCNSREQILESVSVQSWDILVLDVYVNDENSLEHLSSFRSLFPDTPIAIMTAGRDPIFETASQALNQARRAHADFLLPKPFELVDVIQIADGLDKFKQRLNIEPGAVYL